MTSLTRAEMIEAVEEALSAGGYDCAASVPVTAVDAILARKASYMRSYRASKRDQSVKGVGE